MKNFFFWHIYCNTINFCLPDLRFSNQQVLFIWLTFPTYGSKKKNNRGPLNWQILLEQTILSLLCLITNINLVHLVMMAYKCSINELHMQTLSTTYNWPSSLKAKQSTSNSKAPLMNLEYQNNNSLNTDTAVLTFLWPVSLMMQINFCHITDLQDNIFVLAWTIWINSYNIYQVFLFSSYLSDLLSMKSIWTVQRKHLTETK